MDIPYIEVPSDQQQGPDYLGALFTGVIAIADLYEKDGISFYLGKYVHFEYLVGEEAQHAHQKNSQSSESEHELFR